MQIIHRCRDPYGVLSDNRKLLLEQLLQTPDQCLWERARGLIIRPAPLLTLESAVRAIRGSRHSASVPDPFTLYRALRYAVDHDASGVLPEPGGICR